jgi:hypothetical protein
LDGSAGRSDYHFFKSIVSGATLIVTWKLQSFLLPFETAPSSAPAPVLAR